MRNSRITCHSFSPKTFPYHITHSEQLCEGASDIHEKGFVFDLVYLKAGLLMGSDEEKMLSGSILFCGVFGILETKRQKKKTPTDMQILVV